MPTKTNWKVRRFLMFVVVAFCMSVVWRGMPMETKTADTAVTLAFYTIIGVMIVYVWGAIADDHIETFIKAKFGGRHAETDQFDTR